MAGTIYKDSTIAENLKQYSYMKAMEFSADDGVKSKIEDLLTTMETMLAETNADINNLKFNDTIEHNMLCLVLMRAMEYGGNLGLKSTIEKILDTAEDIILD